MSERAPEKPGSSPPPTPTPPPRFRDGATRTLRPITGKIIPRHGNGKLSGELYIFLCQFAFFNQITFIGKYSLAEAAAAPLFIEAPIKIKTNLKRAIRTR